MSYFPKFGKDESKTKVESPKPETKVEIKAQPTPAATKSLLKDPNNMTKKECLYEMDKIEVEYNLVSLIPLDHRYWQLRNRVVYHDAQNSLVK